MLIDVGINKQVLLLVHDFIIRILVIGTSYKRLISSSKPYLNHHLYI